VARPGRTVPAACDDPALTASEAADYQGISLGAWWRAVAAGRYSPPFYPTPRAPRWRKSRIDADNAALTMLPSDAKAKRLAMRHEK
jgi:hypothetical protein